MSSVVEQGEGRIERYLEAFESGVGRPAAPAWLDARRRQAIDHFASLGFPTTHDEEYRFTNVAAIASTPFERPEAERVEVSAIADHLYGEETAAELVFINGRFTESLSSLDRLPRGAMVTSLAHALRTSPGDVESLATVASTDTSAFSALNTALFEDGAVIRLGRNVIVEQPINLVFVTTGGTTPTVSYPRVLVIAGEQSECRVIESHVGLGDGRHFSCAVTELVCGPNSRVDHDRVQWERPEGYHYCRLQIRAERSATVASHAFSFGGAIVRNDLGAVLAGPGVDCTLNGLYMADDRTLVDNHTTIDHAEPHCGSHEVYKGILGGRARGVFNGKIIVREDAQKTDAKQTNKALLLSDTAQFNTKPQLEIFADDVKCTHGATVGQLDAEALFYLQARGIGRDVARTLLIRGFAGDIVNRVKFEPLRERLDGWLISEMPGSVA